MFTKKNRKDFFYFLSKKYKFRSRAAFKLIELNKKFKFLNHAESVLDLCAAPGGWLQVARKFSPPFAHIIGVDACNILPIEGCYTLKGDITSFGCLFAIFNIEIFKKKKIDVVLHDGAPRMGTSWTRDAFNQNDLALNAFKLATCCLKKKGWFVTKIFCSGNIHGFLFALRFFFKKIFVCKPIASRKTSSETYLICKNFIVPFKIDKAILDKKYLFGNQYLVKKNPKCSRIKKKKFKRKILENISHIIRFKKKKKNLKNKIVFLTDECLSYFGMTFIGSLFFNKKLRNELHETTMNIFFIFLVYWCRHFS
ncbi:SAM-dependent methyltransferase (nucleomorph) [Chroomonas mesostigmatica CCMP1168]|uniref:SAM-dependent methyltransferase n=1 Tax=Chroomonas mesostigmatica CCMP1168 TaxID=1195612 RepID=J7G2E3_9CRYP|nr:SAM-dependent methyltransferase [Chroomonas mesostigmatica CCMP1168]